MRKLLTLGLLMTTLSMPVVKAETLTVTIENVNASEGLLMLQIMAGQKEFNGEVSAMTSIAQQAIAGEVSFTISHLPAGDYGIRIMHDINGNSKLDSNLVGMPTEPWGFSNNAAGNFGPPKWDDVKFTLSGSITQNIRLND